MQNQLKKKHSLFVIYAAILQGYRAFPKMLRNRRRRIVDLKMMERLMLATTEVNGCDVCSYAHTRIALNEGFTPEEIQGFLSGSKAYVREEEATAILYAQHVADTDGHPATASYDRLVAVYGVEPASIMDAGIRVMMLGNLTGIPWSALLRRLKGRPYGNSSLAGELGMILVQPILLVMAIPHALMQGLGKR